MVDVVPGPADLAERVLAFCRLDRSGRVALRNRAEAHSRVFDWTTLSSAYHQAHDQAYALITVENLPAR